MKKATGKSNISIVKDYLSGERPFLQVGYTPDLVQRVEGEVWESGGRKWIFKDGRKQALTTPSKFLIKFECSDCNMNINLFGDKMDKKFYNKTGRCFECQIKFESKLKIQGKYENYEKTKIFQNQKSYCLDMKKQLEDTIKALENKDNVLKYMNEDGSFDVWTDTMREKMLDGANKELIECNESLQRIEEQLKILQQNESTN